MLRLDNNKYIQTIYNKSVDLTIYKEDGYIARHQDEEKDHEELIEEEKWNRLEKKCGTEAQQSNEAVYAELKLHKASDIYIFEKDANPKIQLLTHKEEYIPYPHRSTLLQAISKAMFYQEEKNLIDYHPTLDQLSGDLKQVVENENKAPQEIVAKIRNIIHQSTQSYHKDLCSIESQQKIENYFEIISSRKFLLDQWGKKPKLSPSHFLWLPARFVFDTTTEQYQCKGKMFEHLEDWPGMGELKQEVSALVTYFAPALKTIHNYFKDLSYLLYNEYRYLGPDQNIEIKKKVNFDTEIRAIVKIAEIEIKPHSVYSGQWHVEGFSSDNVMYTCLYIIEQDEKLVDGSIKFKRAVRDDDAPPDGANQIQGAHSYCPSYSYLCDPKKLIPLGSLDIKENLMIVFPNQNIHKVKGITNNTDVPLKRKVVALFVVNHVDQPYTLNDITLTASLEEIKNHRLKDMYERSKNKQTDTQEFNYCEH